MEYSAKDLNLHPVISFLFLHLSNKFRILIRHGRREIVATIEHMNGITNHHGHRLPPERFGVAQLYH